jgi:RimJ/RimL family protein N-acetyltransferase
MLSDRPPAPRLTTQRLVLEPLRVDHADELAPLFDDLRLHVFIGGAPATRGELRSLYRRQVVGQSRDGSEHWLNWVARQRADDAAIGTLQATVTAPNGEFSAEVAWVIGVPYQGQGFASEAAAAVAAWLRAQGAKTLVAHVHPDHQSSMGVARAVGLSPTSVVVDGETRWMG